MTSVASAIGLYNMDLISDSILEDLNNPAKSALHYKHWQPSQTNSELYLTWKRAEESRVRKYIFLSTHMVQNQLSELGDEAAVASLSTETPLASLRGISSTSSLQSLVVPKQEHEANNTTSSIDHFSRFPSMEDVSMRLDALCGAPESSLALNPHSNSCGSLSTLSKSSSSTPSSQTRQVPTRANTSCSNCTMHRDLCTFAAASFPSDVYHTFLYTCAVGMDMSVETLVQAIILFSRVTRHKSFRESLLPLEIMLRSHNSNQRTAASPFSFHDRPPRRHYTLNRAEDKYGCFKLWSTLEQRVVRSVSKFTVMDQHTGCSCFSRTSSDFLEDMLWTLHENLICALLTCCCIAVKTCEDTLWANRCWSKVSGFSVSDVNTMEATILELLAFRTYVSPEQYTDFVVKYCGPYAQRVKPALVLVTSKSCPSTPQPTPRPEKCESDPSLIPVAVDSKLVCHSTDQLTSSDSLLTRPSSKSFKRALSCFYRPQSAMTDTESCQTTTHSFRQSHTTKSATQAPPKPRKQPSLTNIRSSLLVANKLKWW